MNPPCLDDYHLRLPATSANLGPAFDTAAVALNLHLEIDARAAQQFAICSTGRDADACARMEKNLILDTYRRTLAENQAGVVPLHLTVNNQIPLGMGCGSSAAARLAGIALARQYGGLDWTDQQVISAASSLEGHPDNVAACWLGGMTVAAVCRQEHCCRQVSEPAHAIVHAARIEIPNAWRAVLVLPRVPVRTEESREVLPGSYTRTDTVENLQRCGLLVAAFATGRSDLLRSAMHDRLHQPYRSEFCPLLGKLLPLRTEPGVLGVSLSGAGPAVLLVVERTLEVERLQQSILRLVGDPIEAEVLACGFSGTGAIGKSEKNLTFSMQNVPGVQLR